ncbi:hypothetical protein Q0812_10385 [Brevundimonas sp. 2R-24]|uniref:Uncharacterized protein n=1 Tax=Peiella sedimenti TaxID=3061083 RepID=A0ABT8SPQ2_9CAUL|nr:hypothetical protein [Caulobacteraceae bacterium XZ-24]
MMNLEDHLLADSLTPEAEYACPLCLRRGPPFMFAATHEDDRFEHDYVCSTCLRDAERAEIAAAEADADAEADWSAVKVERNRRINEALWAVSPGSPLTQECQAAFAAMIGELHRVTIDFYTPADVVWPIIPELAFEAPPGEG